MHWFFRGILLLQICWAALVHWTQRHIIRLKYSPAVLIRDKALKIDYCYQGQVYSILVPYDYSHVWHMQNLECRSAGVSWHQQPGVPILISQTELGAVIHINGMQYETAPGFVQGMTEE